MAYALEDYYNTGDDGYSNVHVTSYVAQTFTPSSGFTISRVGAKFIKVGATVGTLTIQIRNTSAGVPGAVVHASTTGSTGDVSTGAAGWYYYNFGSPYALSGGTVYALVMVLDYGNSGDCLRWYRDGSSPTYAGGQLYAGPNGASWTGYAGYDQMFEAYSGSGGGIVLLSMHHIRMMAGAM